MRLQISSYCFVKTIFCSKTVCFVMFHNQNQHRENENYEISLHKSQKNCKTRNKKLCKAVYHPKQRKMICRCKFCSYPGFSAGEGLYRKIGKSKNGNSVFFRQRHALSTSFDIFVVTYRVTNFCQNSWTCYYFLFLGGKKLNFHFWFSPIFRLCPGDHRRIQDLGQGGLVEF